MALQDKLIDSLGSFATKFNSYRYIMAIKSAFITLMPVIIVGGLRGGLFTPTEAAVVAAVYALAVSTLLYRELTWAGLVEVLTRASRTTASV